MKSAELGFKKRDVGLVVLFTFLTLGIYIGYWFLKEKQTFESNNYNRIIPMKLWAVATIFLSISFFYHFIGAAFFTPYGKALFNSIDIIFTFYYLGLLYYSVFRIRALIEDSYNEEIFKPWLLVLFNVWYLQFKINRLNEEPEVIARTKVPVTD